MNKTKLRSMAFKFKNLLILLALMTMLTILLPNMFLTAANFKSIFLAISIYGIMVCGTIYTILLGGIDLSVGGVAAMSGAATVLIVNSGSTNGVVIAGILAGLAVGVLAGLSHGLLLANFQVPAFLVTLASQSIVYGIAQLITDNQLISCLWSDIFNFLGGGRLLGISFSIYILVLCGISSYLLLNFTTFGRSVYIVGGNRIAAELSGISSKKIIILAYTISGFTAALAGIVLASMNQQAFSRAAQGYENDVLTAIVVGGTSLMGGEGSLQGAMYGALLVSIINNGLRLLGVPPTYHSVVKGLVIIIAVSLDCYSRYINSGLKQKTVMTDFFSRTKRKPVA